jgi:hypothetical protein
MGIASTIAALHAAEELSTRARNALANDAGCETLADVAAMTEEKVRRLANVGAGTVAEIKSVLSANGLAFATESLEEEEEEGPRFEPCLWMVMDPWRDLRMMVRAIDKGIRYPGVSEQRHARFIRDAREVVDHKRKRERRMKAMIGRAVARLPPQDDATAANWIPKAGWDERRLCSTPIASLEEAQEILNVLKWCWDEALDPLDDRLDHALDNLEAFLRPRNRGQRHECRA